MSVDDLEWLEAMFKEVGQEMVGLMANLGSGNRLISGGEVTSVTSSTRNINGGWVFWDGELVKFNGLSLTGSGYVVLTKSTVNVAPSRIYANGATVWVYRDTIATVGLTPTLGNSALFYLETAVRFGVSAWTNATLISPDWVTYSPSPLLYHVPAHRVHVNGSVELRGRLQVGGSGTLPTAFVLPAGRWPKRTVAFPCPIYTGAGLTAGVVEVNAIGEVNVLGYSATAGHHLSLDGMVFDTRQ